MPDRGWAAQADSPFVTWAARGRAMRGQKVSGDQYAVRVGGARTVLAVIDGLGHGEDAAAAAEAAVAVVDHNPAEPLEVLLLLVHRELQESRGAVATIAIVEGETGQLNWLGVGNVDGVLLRADPDARPRTHGVFLVGGVLGYHLQNLHQPGPIQLDDGDLILLATDGIRGDLADPTAAEVPVERLAESILAKYARPDDDALVLVARYHTPSPEIAADAPNETSYYGPLVGSGDTAGLEPGFGPLGTSSTSSTSATSSTSSTSTWRTDPPPR